MKTLITLVCCAALLCGFFVLPTEAGIRAPGPYNGVVIFDRWDACYLYSGIYLMPISEQIKDGLRNFEGKFVQVDAQDVYQPLNPGDGLIRKIGLVETDKIRDVGPQLPIGLALRVVPVFDSTAVPVLNLEMENRGADAIEVSPGALAVTLFAKKDERKPAYFEPADGPSFAAVTRVRVASLSTERSVAESSTEGRTWRYEVSLIGTKKPSENLKIRPGERSTVTTLKLSIPSGEYEFLAGYGGGVHESPVLVSNPVAFDVSKEGVATLVNATGHH